MPPDCTKPPYLYRDFTRDPTIKAFKKEILNQGPAVLRRRVFLNPEPQTPNNTPNHKS